MTMEQMEPPDVRRGREMGGKKKVSEYQMDRYLLGLMSEAERLAFEMMLEVDEAARRQFQRFEALWEAERFDARRHRMPALPVEMAQPRRMGDLARKCGGGGIEFGVVGEPNGVLDVNGDGIARAALSRRGRAEGSEGLGRQKTGRFTPNARSFESFDANKRSIGWG